jgi:hypothetical protein
MEEPDEPLRPGIDLRQGALRGFDIRLRGFDQRKVEQHVRALEAAISDLRKMNDELDKRIVELRRLLMSPN